MSKLLIIIAALMGIVILSVGINTLNAEVKKEAALPEALVSDAKADFLVLTDVNSKVAVQLATVGADEEKFDFKKSDLSPIIENKYRITNTQYKEKIEKMLSTRIFDDNFYRLLDEGISITNTSILDQQLKDGLEEFSLCNNKACYVYREYDLDSYTEPCDISVFKEVCTTVGYGDVSTDEDFINIVTFQIKEHSTFDLTSRLEKIAKPIFLDPISNSQLEALYFDYFDSHMAFFGEVEYRKYFAGPVTCNVNVCQFEVLGSDKNGYLSKIGQNFILRGIEDYCSIDRRQGKYFVDCKHYLEG